MEHHNRQQWINGLSEDDLAFVKRFILASGSLKELAKAYSISYPTVRLRLDRLIEKVRILDDHQITTEFERLLRVLYAEGKVDMNTFTRILAAHGKGSEESK